MARHFQTFLHKMIFKRKQSTNLNAVLFKLFYNATEGNKFGAAIDVAGILIPGFPIDKTKIVAQQAAKTIEKVVELADKYKIRTVPGTPGRVIGENSTELGKNLFSEMGLPRSTSRTGYQAQHVFPYITARRSSLINTIGMDVDYASNGIFLRETDEFISTMSRHLGRHPIYTKVVANGLAKIEAMPSLEGMPNASIGLLDARVYVFQQQLIYLQQQGLPIYKDFGASVDLWERWLYE